MVIEKQAKRKKLLLFGIPALVVVFGATFALLFLFVFGGGMSSDEYRNQVGEKHNNVVLALKEVDQEWLWADVSEEPYSECYPTVQVCVDDAASTIAEAQAALAEIKPPQEVSALHEELAAYYGDVDAYLTRADLVLSFLTNWYAVTEKANDYSYAIDQYDGNPNVAPAEFIGWMDTDIAALNGFLQQASELEAPEECQALTQEYIAMLQDELDIMERIKRALINRDWMAYDVAVADLDTLFNGLEARVEASLDEIFTFYDTFSGLIDRGEALRDRIKSDIFPAEGELVSLVSF